MTTSPVESTRHTEINNPTERRLPRTLQDVPLPPPDQPEICEQGDSRVHAEDRIDGAAIRRWTTVRYVLCRRFAKELGTYIGVMRPRSPA